MEDIFFVIMPLEWFGQRWELEEANLFPCVPRKVTPHIPWAPRGESISQALSPIELGLSLGNSIQH